MSRIYYCKVKTCNNRSSDCQKKGIKLHKFPRNENIRKQWLENMDLEDLEPTESMRICSEHFTDGNYEFQNFTNAKILKSGAIPTILSPDDLKTQNSSKINSPERSANTPLLLNIFDMRSSGSHVEGKPSNDSQYPDYVPSLSVVEGCKKPLQALQLLHSYRKILPKNNIKISTARKTFPHSKNNILKPEDFSFPLSPENSLENGQVHLTRSIAQIHQSESLQIALDPNICSFVQSISEDSNTQSEKEDARENSDVLEESDDNEEIKEMLVRKKRKIRQKSLSSEVLNASSSVKKHYDFASEKKSHSNSSSLKKVHNTSVSQKKFHIPSQKKKKQRSLSPEKKLHNFFSQNKINNSLYSETDQKNSSLSKKERKNSSSSNKELKSSSGKKFKSFSDLESKNEFHKVSSPSDIIDNVSALNSWDKEDIFAQYVASELRTLRNYPHLYLQTKQAIVKSITSANDELLNLDS